MSIAYQYRLRPAAESTVREDHLRFPPYMMSSSNSTPLHQMNPLSRFDNRAEDYARYRPSYPDEVIATILAGLGEPSQLTAADVGAGTGISARLLAARGLTVWAIEPNADMQRAATPHSGVTFQTGVAEQTGLAAASVDLVTCFQAFHWFDPVRSLAEFHRILRASGWLALVWNDRDTQDEFTASYSRLVRAVSDNHPAENRSLAVAADAVTTSPFFQSFQPHSFVYQQQVDLEALIGRARSTSYVPRQGAIYEQFLADLTAVHTRWADSNGMVYFVYSTNVFLAEASSL